jgi:hypothetical protein
MAPDVDIWSRTIYISYEVIEQEPCSTRAMRIKYKLALLKRNLRECRQKSHKAEGP